MIPSRIFGALSVLAILTPSAANADLLASNPIQSVSGPGSVSGSAVTVAVNNYPSMNPINTFTLADTVSSTTAPLDIVLQGTNTGGITQYHVTETLTNATVSMLTGVEFQVGTGTGSNFSAYTLGPAFFSTYPILSSPDFYRGSQTYGEVSFSDGVVAVNGSATLSFGLGVADFATTPNSFTLRELVTPVPEPASLFLCGSVVVGSLIRQVFRRRRTDD